MGDLSNLRISTEEESVETLFFFRGGGVGGLPSWVEITLLQTLLLLLELSTAEQFSAFMPRIHWL
jgi:hypothetical protein